MWAMLLALVVLIKRDPEANHRLGGLVPLNVLLAERPLRKYLKLGVPSAIFITAESSAFDGSVLLAGLVGAVPAAAWSVIVQTTVLFFSMTVGISTAACALVGRAIGRERPAEAKRYAFLAVMFAVLQSTITSTICVLWSHEVFGVTTTDPEVHRVIRQMIWIIPPFHILDCTQFSFQGISSAAGSNHLGAAVLLVSLCGIGLPLAYVLGIMNQYGILGVAGGLTIGMGIEVPLLIAMVLCTFHWKPAISTSANASFANSPESQASPQFVGDDADDLADV